jgi:hypothetical protein
MILQIQQSHERFIEYFHVLMSLALLGMQPLRVLLDHHIIRHLLDFSLCYLLANEDANQKV